MALNTVLGVIMGNLQTHEKQRFKIRIKEMKLIKAGELTDHAGNWRMHPIFQRDGLIGDLEEIGITDVIKAYYSERNEGKLVIIDGHLRKSIDHEQLWPVLILDLNDEEADKQLILHDSIGSMAVTDAEKLDALIKRATFVNRRARETVSRIHDSVREQAELIKRLRDDNKDDNEGAVLRRQLNEMRGKGVKIVVPIENGLALVEDALAATGNRNRSLALIEICNFYLENKVGDDGI